MYRLPNHIRIRHFLRVGWLLLILQTSSAAVKAQSETSFPLRVGEGWLILLVYPASRPLVGDSPRTLLWSALNIELRRMLSLKKEVPFAEDNGRPGVLHTPYLSTIGHTIAWLQWMEEDGSIREEWASLTGRDFAGIALRRLVWEGRGLGILFDTYPDAYVLGREENLLRLFHYRGRREAAPVAARYLAFPLLLQDCAPALDLIRDFREAAAPGPATTDGGGEGTGLVFSSVMDPYMAWQKWRQGAPEPLGGGCATLGMALLKAAGQFHPAMDSLWNTVLDVPEDLIGEEGRYVPIFKVLSGTASGTWERAPGQTRRFVNADPERIWQWIGEAGNASAEGILIPGLLVQQGPSIELGYPPKSAKGRFSEKNPDICLEGVVLTKGKE